MKLSDNLKNIRKENNLSQEQLAEKLGVSRQAVSKWESGQSYPEMDKVLLICKTFNYNIDELMNENIKEVSETKQAKININKYIDDFLGFITKTVDMLSSMKSKQKLKCFVEQFFVIIFLVCIFAIIKVIASEIFSCFVLILPHSIYYPITSILFSIYIILAIILGVTIFLHIFKVRYLDYYEIIKEDEVKKINEDSEDKITEKSENEEKQEMFIEKKKEKIIIRDPEHSSSNFLTGIIRVVLWCIKFIAVCFALFFAFTFITLVVLLILSFLFIKTGMVFFGSLFSIISAIAINYIILELCYNFIVSKKTKKNKIAIIFIISLVLAGIGIGMVLIGMTQFNYIENPEECNEIEDSYNVQMMDNLLIINYYKDIEYIETDIDDIKIVIKHTKYYNTNIVNQNEIIYINYFQDKSKIMEAIRDSIKDINNKEIKNYDNITIYVYTSKENIEKLKQNQYNHFNTVNTNEYEYDYEE